MNLNQLTKYGTAAMLGGLAVLTPILTSGRWPSTNEWAGVAGGAISAVVALYLKSPHGDTTNA